MDFNWIVIWLGGLLAIPVTLVIVLRLLGRAADRYARRQREAGRWDANGPLHPTDPPRNWRRYFGAAGPITPRIEHDDEPEV